MGILRLATARFTWTCLAGALSAQAEIVTDGSLGAARVLTGPAFQIPDTLGRRVGNNLFQSFQTFNIGLGESATFTGPSSIANVLARVTGGQSSSINGTLQCTMPAANFFLINPAGVVFGPGAKVDVGGAFAVTTADYIKLADGGRFDARTPVNDVLTVAPPSAFGFLTPPPGVNVADVLFVGSQVEVKAGKDVAIVAGGVGAGDGALARAPGGKLNVAAVASKGELPLEGFDTSGFELLGDILLIGDSLFSSSSDTGGGSFHIRAQDFYLEGTAFGSGLVNNTRQSGIGGDSEIQLRGTLTLSDASFITSSAAGTGQGGNLDINVDQVELQGGSVINLWTGVPGQSGEGKGGDLSIQARGIIMKGQSSISANTYGPGFGGDIHVQADAVALDGPTSPLDAPTYIGTTAGGSGASGKTIINAGTIQLNHFSEFSSDAISTGDAGDLEVSGNSISLADGAKITSRSWGAGATGNLRLHDIGTLNLSGSATMINAETFGVIGPVNAGRISISAGNIRLDDLASISSRADGAGNAASIEVETGRLDIGNYANVSTVTLGAGNGGSLSVDADTVNIVKGYMDSTAYGTGNGGSIAVRANHLIVDAQNEFGDITAAVLGSGQGGAIQIQAQDAHLVNAALVSSATAGTGPAGSLRVTADTLEIKDSELSAASLAEGAAGSGGDLFISATSLSIQNSRVSTSTSGDAQAGTIAINAGSLDVRDFGIVVSETWGAGRGGSILINTGEASLEDLSRISTEAKANGTAGDIELTTTSEGIRLRDFSRISSAAVGGSAGSVKLQAATRIDVLDESKVAVSSAGSDAGTISLLAPDYVLVQNSQISAEAYLNGGSIAIDPSIFGLDNSSLYANAIEGNGGHIQITADFMYQLGDWSIRYDSANQSAQPGTLSIRSGVDFAGSLVGLPGGLLAGGNQMREGCARRNPRSNSFVVRGKGGVSWRPDSFILVNSLEPPSFQHDTDAHQ